MGKNHIAVLFNTNIDLINDWRFEKSFSLHFYSGLLKQEHERKIFIGKLKTIILIFYQEFNIEDFL